MLPVLLNFCILYFKGHLLLKPGDDGWAKYASMSWHTAAVLPLFVVLLTSMVVGVENKAEGWKHLFALPVGRLPVWLSKRQSGFGLPVAAGMAGLVAGLTLLHWGHVGWIPYAGLILTLLTTPFKPAPGMTVPAVAPHEWHQLLWFGAAAVLCYAVLRWRNLA
jgi:hypothetical protein